MPKPMFVWSGSAWVSVASEVESLATYATQSYADNSSNVASGSKLLVPTSVAIGSGSSSVSTLGTVTVTGASSVSLNGVFSSTYDSYRISINATASSGNPDLTMRLRANGTDNTAANYNTQNLRANNATASASRSSGQTLFYIGFVQTSGVYNNSIIELSNPNRTMFTNLTSTSGLDWYDLHLRSGSHEVSASYDGLTIGVAAGTMTGTVSVYGYKK